MKENEVQKAILFKLEGHKNAGEIIWYSRLNSGKVNSGAYWIKLCEVGTPDIMSVVNCGNGKIAILFIEVKRTKVTRLRFEQQKFFDSMDGKPMILCTVINDPKQLWPAIKRARDL